MIQSERQYHITSAQIDKFAKALENAKARSHVNPLLRRIEEDALRSQLDELREELQEYKRLCSDGRI